VIEEDSAAARPNAPPRKMVTEGLRKSLTKQVQNLNRLAILSSLFVLRCYSQGYRIVGSHSGVKLCR
jgi:hypothetical protein